MLVRGRARKVLLLSFGGFIVIVAAAMIGRWLFGGGSGLDCGHSPPGPSETVRRHIELADEGNVDCAFQMLSRRQMNSQGGPKFVRGLIVVWISAIHDQGRLTGVEIVRQSVVGNAAMVDVKLSLEYGGTRERSYGLIREDGEWKIDDF